MIGGEDGLSGCWISIKRTFIGELGLGDRSSDARLGRQRDGRQRDRSLIHRGGPTRSGIRRIRRSGWARGFGCRRIRRPWGHDRVLRIEVLTAGVGGRHFSRAMVQQGTGSVCIAQRRTPTHRVHFLHTRKPSTALQRLMPPARHTVAIWSRGTPSNGRSAGVLLRRRHYRQRRAATHR